MNINATILGQMIAFAFFVWFCMKYVWPPLTAALAERAKKIADGLEAAERAGKDLELAQERAAEQLREAKTEASGIIEQANKRASQIIDEAKEQAVGTDDALLALVVLTDEDERLAQRAAALPRTFPSGATSSSRNARRSPSMLARSPL